jgi:hypothetical protein
VTLSIHGPFINQFASLCRDHVTRAKWVFVLSHAIGRTIGERVALSGTNWLNLRFVTPLDVTLHMGAVRRRTGHRAQEGCKVTEST